MYYEVKARFEKTMEDGMVRKVKEPYMFDALSFSEAEERAVEELAPYISGDFEVTDIKRVSYNEIFPTDDLEADKWYAVRINFITLDERTGKEKKTKAEYLVQASGIDNARDSFNAATERGLLTRSSPESISMMRPASTTAMRSQKRSASSMSWLT